MLLCVKSEQTMHIPYIILSLLYKLKLRCILLTMMHVVNRKWTSLFDLPLNIVSRTYSILRIIFCELIWWRSIQRPIGISFSLPLCRFNIPFFGAHCFTPQNSNIINVDSNPLTARTKKTQKKTNFITITEFVVSSSRCHWWCEWPPHAYTHKIDFKMTFFHMLHAQNSKWKFELLSENDFNEKWLNDVDHLRNAINKAINNAIESMTLDDPQKCARLRAVQATPVEKEIRRALGKWLGFRIKYKIIMKKTLFLSVLISYLLRQQCVFVRVEWCDCFPFFFIFFSSI